MTIVESIEEQYFDIENQYSTKEFDAHAIGDTATEDYWRRRRELNTHAYFLFLFTRLEDHIKTESNAIIEDRKINLIDWKERANWENTDSDNLHFKKRVALLTQRGHSVFNKIVEYYDVRNKIGHGKTIPDILVQINMIDVFTNMKTYFTSLIRY